MAIDEEGIVDVINDYDEETILTIIDPYEWGDDDNKHLFLLQKKINSYLSFIESGELLKKHPSAYGKKIVISVIGQYELSGEGKRFYDSVKEIICSAGFYFRFSLFSE